MEHIHPLNSILIELMKRILDLKFLIIGKDFNMNYEHLLVNNSHTLYMCEGEGSLKELYRKIGA